MVNVSPRGAGLLGGKWARCLRRVRAQSLSNMGFGFCNCNDKTVARAYDPHKDRAVAVVSVPAVFGNGALKMPPTLPRS